VEYGDVGDNTGSVRADSADADTDDDDDAAVVDNGEHNDIGEAGIGVDDDI